MATAKVGAIFITIKLHQMKSIYLFPLVVISIILNSCERYCLSPEQEARNRKYYEEQSLMKYLLTENATKRVFVTASTDNPSDTDSTGFIRSFIFQHLAGNGYDYKTTDQFTFDSLSKDKSFQIAYVGGYRLIDTASGKFFMNNNRQIDSTKVEINVNPWVIGMLGFEIYGNNFKEYKQINISRVMPTIIVANPQKTTDFKSLANAYNWYLWGTAGFETNIFYKSGK